jgi:hypothetical protein
LKGIVPDRMSRNAPGHKPIRKFTPRPDRARAASFCSSRQSRRAPRPHRARLLELALEDGKVTKASYRAAIDRHVVENDVEYEEPSWAQLRRSAARRICSARYRSFTCFPQSRTTRPKLIERPLPRLSQVDGGRAFPGSDVGDGCRKVRMLPCLVWR